MTMLIKASDLLSRKVRTSVASNGIRRFQGFGKISKQDQQGGFLGWLISAAAKFTGFLIGAVWRILSGGIQLSWTALWGGIVATSRFIWNFNWNITQEEVDQQINSMLVNLAGQTGGFLGSALGFVVGGAVSGSILFSFNEALGLHVLKNVGEEALDELAVGLEQIIRLAVGATTKAIGYYLYLKIRTKLFGEQKDDKPWSLALELEDRIEEIENEPFQEFLQELLDNFGDTVEQVGYVVTQTVDTFMVEQSLASEQLLGQRKTIKVAPNRDVPDDYFLLSGPQKLLEQQIQQQLILQGELEEVKNENRLTVSTYDASNESVENRPKITLYFKKHNSRKNKSYQLELSYRLMDKTLSTITLSEAKSIGNKIRQLMTGFEVKKGQGVARYHNLAQGFKGSWFFARSEQEAVRVYEKILDLQGKSLDKTKLTYTFKVALPVNEKQLILGETQEEDSRPSVTVTFYDAVMFLGSHRVIPLLTL
ncbi:MAG: hypothetical protein F6K21_05545 [Symploca sp. SIO2D2]|nr:hypothetical protein [Symploca sp. SIO2D2]